MDPADQPPRAPRRAGSTRSTLPDAQRRADVLRLRRAFGNLGLTLVVPGSAQLLHGDQRLGRAAIRTWVALWGVLLALLAVFAVSRGSALAIVTFMPITWLLTLGLGAAGLGWALLMMDAWRLSRPPELARRHRLGYGLVAGALALALGAGGIASATVVQAQGDFLGTVFSGGGDTRTKGGRFNVLLLGGDAGAGREGLRPDSMTVASIDATTGKTVLFSLPRNLEDVEFPDSSPLKKVYPGRFSCPNHACLLNAVYTTAMEHKDLYPGVKDPGAVATKEAVSWVTGLEINYYALIDLNGFKSLIDAVGGVKVDVLRRVPVGGGSTEVKRYLEPGRAVHLNGQDALWYARSRHESTDYERMARQKCVMNAMLNQLDPVTVVTKFQSITGAGKQVVETDVPTSEMERLAILAMKARRTKIASVSFVPPLVQPGRPDFAVIRDTVRTRIAASAQTPLPPKGGQVLTPPPPPPPPVPAPPVSVPRGAASASSAPGATRTPTRAAKKVSPTPTPTPTPTPQAGADDLGLVCEAA